MTSSVEATAPTPPVGVIESLAQGFETVAGRLVLLLLPLLLDLALWVGPRIDYQPALQEAYRQFVDGSEMLLAQDDEALRSSWTTLADSFAEVARSTPISHLPLVGFPTLLASRPVEHLPFRLTPPTWEVKHASGALAARAAALGIGILVSCVYLALIAGEVRDHQIKVGRIMRRLPITVMQVLLLLVLVAGVAITLLAPFLLIGGRLSLASGFMAQVGGFITLTGAVVLLWVAMFAVFTIHGLLLHERSLPGAIWDSIRVVQWNTAPTFVFILLSLIISWSLTRFIWSQPDTGSWLVLVGIGGHAFISTGLITASFIFFKDRYRYWQEMRAELLAELERRRAEYHRQG